MFKDDEILIPIEERENTKIQCSKELAQLRFKKEHNSFRIIIQFLSLEFRNYFLLLIIGLLLLLLASFSTQEEVLVYSIIGFFMVIGCVSMFEYCKNDLYGMDELLSVAIINPQKALVYKIICVSLIEIVLFSIVMIIMHQHIGINMYEMFTYTLLPIFIAQVFTLLLSGIQFHTILSTTLSISLHAIITVIFKSLEVVKYLTWMNMSILLLIIFLSYIVLLKDIYQKGTGGKLKWNLF